MIIKQGTNSKLHFIINLNQVKINVLKSFFEKRHLYYQNNHSYRNTRTCHINKRFINNLIRI